MMQTSIICFQMLGVVRAVKSVEGRIVLEILYFILFI
jgi:hypothetical protein